MIFAKIVLWAMALSLAGCVGTGGGTTNDMSTAATALGGLREAKEPPSKEDMALSCAQLGTRLSNLYGRYSEIEREQRARQMQNEMVSGIVSIGATIAGGSALAGAGSAAAIRNVGLATNYGRAALAGLATQESSAQKLKDVNDSMLIAQRITQLEKVKFDKGCA